MSHLIGMGKPDYIVGGKYRLIRKIGSGSFGDIYLGINVTNGEVNITSNVRFNGQCNLKARVRFGTDSRTFLCVNRRNGIVMATTRNGSHVHKTDCNPFFIYVFLLSSTSPSTLKSYFLCVFRLKFYRKTVPVRNPTCFATVEK